MPQSLAGLIEMRWRPIGDDHLHARVDKCSGDTQPDATGAAGNERHPVFYIQHALASLRG
jgi:hypothetical protein